MSDDWRERLREVLKSDGRSMRAISAAAQVGENYLQQMLKDEKDPGFSRLARVLSALGPEATVYVASAGSLDPEMHLRVALIAYGVTDDENLRTALLLAKKLSGQTTAAQPGSTRPVDQAEPANPLRAREPSE